MRVLFEVYDDAMTLDRLRAAFAPVAGSADMTWRCGPRTRSTGR